MANKYHKLPFYNEVLTENGIAIIDRIKVLDKNHRVTVLLKQAIELLDNGNFPAVLDLYADKENLMSNFTSEEIFIFKTVFFDTKLIFYDRYYAAFALKSVFLPQYPNFECPYNHSYGTCLPWIITELKNNTDIDFTSINSLIANDKTMIKNRNVSRFYKAIFYEYEDAIIVVDCVKTLPNDHRVTIMLKRAIELWEDGNIADFLDLYSDKNDERSDFTIEELFMFKGTQFHTNFKVFPQYPKFYLSYAEHGTCLSWIVEEIQQNTDIGLREDYYTLDDDGTTDVTYSRFDDKQVVLKEDGLHMNKDVIVNGEVVEEDADVIVNDKLLLKSARKLAKLLEEGKEDDFFALVLDVSKQLSYEDCNLFHAIIFPEHNIDIWNKFWEIYHKKATTEELGIKIESKLTENGIDNFENTIFDDNHRVTSMLKMAIEIWNHGWIPTFLDFCADKKGLRSNFTAEENSAFMSTVFCVEIIYMPQYPKFDLYYRGFGTCLAWIVEELEKNTDIVLLKEGCTKSS
ncbi:MAG: hypothetical protein FWG64_03675 [Firmicutes bacterium]|nr:hypothetical protein [Bacillota bacterium]